MRVALKGTLTFELQGKKQTAQIEGMAFSTAFGKTQYTTKLRVSYGGATHELTFSFAVSPQLNPQQKSAYLENLYAERINAAKKTWPSPWPDVTSTLFIEIGEA
jgi:hypothetical protein